KNFVLKILKFRNTNSGHEMSFPGYQICLHVHWPLSERAAVKPAIHMHSEYNVVCLHGNFHSTAAFQTYFALVNINLANEISLSLSRTASSTDKCSRYHRFDQFPSSDCCCQ